jgi:hypothetical protein
MESKIPL